MKVICIDAAPEKDNLKNFKIKEGKIYEVTEGGPYPITGKPSLFLIELDQFYYKYRFIPLSDIDEKELVNQREEECIS